MNLQAIFNEFISVINENNTYQIALLNQSHHVLSASDQRHNNEQFNFVVQSDNEVYLPILVKGELYGYLWVSGSIENLKIISDLLLESLVTRIQYELNEQILKQKFTQDDELIKLLLDDTGFNQKDVLNLSERLSVDTTLKRVAILITSSEGFQSDEILRLKLKEGSRQMFYSLVDRHNLLLFKDVQKSVASSFKAELERYIQELKEWGLQRCCFYIGTIQDKLSKYRISYQQCVWLKRMVSLSEDEVSFFMDHEFTYVMSKVNLHDISDIFGLALQEHRIDETELIEIARALAQNDYNISQTAQTLYLHKNTLIYKIQKIEDEFSIDIRGSFQGKVFLYLLASTLSEQQQRKQVGEQR